MSKSKEDSGKTRDKKFKSFAEFYPFYLTQHQHPLSRALHYTGTSLSLITMILACINLSLWLALLSLILGYALAWLGHFGFEKNRPATFAHPLWSLRGDFKMLGTFLKSLLRWK